MSPRTFFGALAVVLLAAGCSSAEGAPRLSGMVRTPTPTIELPAVVADDGSTVAFDAPSGGLALVYFGYTNCPDICPTTLADLRAALREIGDGALDRVALTFVTVDPERDTDEIIDVLRAAWTQDPVSFDGRFVSFSDIRVLPQPSRPIPLWIGGSSEAAYRRGIERGDGFQVIGVTPDQAAPTVARLRAARPEAGFTVSLRTGWDPQGMEHDRIRAERDAFEAVGIQHVVAAPWRKSADEWLRSMDELASLVMS